MSSWTGFEPVREDPIWFQVKRLNHSATTTSCMCWYKISDVRLFNEQWAYGLEKINSDQYSWALCTVGLFSHHLVITILYIVLQLFSLGCGHCKFATLITRYNRLFPLDFKTLPYSLDKAAAVNLIHFTNFSRLSKTLRHGEQRNAISKNKMLEW